MSWWQNKNQTMKIALYGLTVNTDFIDELAGLLKLLKEKKIEYYLYRPFLEYIRQDCGLQPEVAGVFESMDDLPEDV